MLSSRKKLTIFQDFINDHTLNFSAKQSTILLQHQSNILDQALFNLGLDNAFLLSEDDSNKLLEELKHIVSFVGGGIPLFENAEYMIPSQAEEQDRMKVMTDNLLKFLLMGTPFKLSALYSKTLLDSLTKEKSPELMEALRSRFHEMLTSINLDRLRALNADGERLFEIQIASVLAMYAICEPSYYENEITLPQKVNGDWRYVKFHITCLPLVPDQKLYPKIYSLYADEKGKIHNHNNCVFAYGLVPSDPSLSDEERLTISSYLLFSGTPPETGQGHLFSVLTDFTPDHSVGETMYLSSKEMLHEWIKEYATNGKVVLIGQSLGAAISLLLVSATPEYVVRVEAFNAPAFYRETWGKPNFQLWSSLARNERPPVYVHTQENDPVKMVGYYHEDWKLTKIFPKRHEVILSSYLAHIRSFVNEPSAVSLFVNTKKENERLLRRVVTGVKSSADGALHRFFSGKIMKANANARRENPDASAKDLPRLS